VSSYEARQRLADLIEKRANPAGINQYTKGGGGAAGAGTITAANADLADSGLSGESGGRPTVVDISSSNGDLVGLSTRIGTTGGGYADVEVSVSRDGATGNYSAPRVRVDHADSFRQDVAEPTPTASKFAASAASILTKHVVAASQV